MSFVLICLSGADCEGVKRFSVKGSPWSLCPRLLGVLWQGLRSVSDKGWCNVSAFFVSYSVWVIVVRGMRFLVKGLLMSVMSLCDWVLYWRGSYVVVLRVVFVDSAVFWGRIDRLLCVKG